MQRFANRPAQPCREQLALLSAFAAKTTELSEATRAFAALGFTAAQAGPRAQAVRQYEDKKREVRELYDLFQEHKNAHGC